MSFPPQDQPESSPRRHWLGAASAFGAALLLPAQARAAKAAGGETQIDQPAVAAPAAFMERATEMKRQAQRAGDQAFGAAIVLAGRVVGQAPSRVVSRRDPTAHAEMEAIRDAARRLDRRDLTGSTLYSTSRPCPMCEAAASLAGIGRMVHGTELTDLGPPNPGRC